MFSFYAKCRAYRVVLVRSWSEFGLPSYCISESHARCFGRYVITTPSLAREASYCADATASLFLVGSELVGCMEMAILSLNPLQKSISNLFFRMHSDDTCISSSKTSFISSQALPQG